MNRLATVIVVVWTTTLYSIHHSNALVAFTYGTDQWRLSLLTSKLELNEDGKVVSVSSNPRRYSYLLGVGAKTNTPYKFLLDSGPATSIDELRNRFSVEVVNKQFYEQVAHHFMRLVGGERAGKDYPGELKIQSSKKSSVKNREFAVRLIGRIMFCWFLKEKKSNNGVPLVPEDMLSAYGVKNSIDYYHFVLEPLFFELLNTPIKDRRQAFRSDEYNKIPYLNGGLFEPHIPDDHYIYSEATESGRIGDVTISDDWFVSFFSVLEMYNFTVDENTAYDVELSIDPEMLGRIFENLLAEINPETGESAKKSTGSFYTPRDIVDYMVDTSLFYYLKDKTSIEDDKLHALISYDDEDDFQRALSDAERFSVVEALSTVRILDPACGSGAFPIGILQKIVYILQQVDSNSALWVKKQFSSVTSPELLRDIEDKQKKGMYDYIRKLGIIRESIFGVDIQTVATEIARLRCFLSLIVEEAVDDAQPNRGIHPLPNLDFKFISANTLIKLDIVAETEQTQHQMSFSDDSTLIDELGKVRAKYFTAQRDEREKLRTEFQSIQRDMQDNALRTYDDNFRNLFIHLSKWDPFANSKTEWFDSELMYGIDKFDILIANPPYIHLEHIKDRSAIYKKLKYSTYEARGDIYALFYERGIELLKDNGVLCYITSNKWMRAGYGKSLRNYFVKDTQPIQLIDFGGQQIFDATVDTNILVLLKKEYVESTRAIIANNKESIEDLYSYVKCNGVDITFAEDSNWIILSEIEQSIKSKIEAAGTPLKDWNIKILYGIKTGLNEAFIINGSKREKILSNCKTDEERQNTEALIRPILRGRDIKRYGYEFADQYLIALFPSHNYNIENYPAVKQWLVSAEWSDSIPSGYGHLRLEQTGKKHAKSGKTFNARKKTNNKWYETQDQIAYWEDFSKKKIVFSRISGDEPCFALDEKGMFTNDTAYIIVGSDLEYLYSQLTSKEIWFAFRKFYMGGGIEREFKVNNLLELPVPKRGVELNFSEEEKQAISDLLPD